MLAAKMWRCGEAASQNKSKGKSSHHECMRLQTENFFLLDIYSKLSIIKNKLGSTVRENRPNQLYNLSIENVIKSLSYKEATSVHSPKKCRKKYYRSICYNFVFCEFHLKMALNYHFLPIRLAKIQVLQHILLRRLVGKQVLS